MNSNKIALALQVLGASPEAAKSCAKRMESATQRTGDSSPSGHLRALAMSLAKAGTDNRSAVLIASSQVLEALGEFARQAETQDRTEAKAKAESAKAKADTPKAPKASPEALILAELPKAPKQAGSRRKAKPDPVKATRKAEAETMEAKIARIVAQVMEAGRLADIS